MNWRKAMRGCGYRLIRFAEAGLPADRLDLSGDRDVEWAWVAGNLPEQPGRVLDFGPATAASGLAAAFRGGEVTGIDLEAPPLPYVHAAHRLLRGDILSYDFGSEKFDTIINCSTIEHVGLPGRYGSEDRADADLRAMHRLRDLMVAPAARMIMTIPVGRDGDFAPAHRVYGSMRLPLLTEGFSCLREMYYAKLPDSHRWEAVTRDAALKI